MRQRQGPGLLGRIGFFIRNRPVLAVAISAVSLLVIASAVTVTTPLRCGPARALGLKGIANGCITAGTVAARPSPTPSPLYRNPVSGPLPPSDNPVSGPIPPQSGPVSPGGVYPPFHPPVTGAATVATLPLDCRLPVYAGPPGSGGFIVFPGGQFIADPTSSVSVPTATPTPQPGGPGYGQGYAGLSYDRQYARWVPVSANQVSPDGSHYAYAATSGFYVVNVANGTHSEMGEGQSWSIVGVQADGVYAGDPNIGGLWAFPFSGAPRQITRTGYWRAATATAAYGTATSAVPQGATNSIIRLDLKTGAISEWFAHAGTQSSVGGFDGKGNPIIYVSYLNGGGSEVWITTGPTSASPIAGYTVPPYGGATGFTTYTAPIADSHGIWFAGTYVLPYGNSPNGVALYVPGSGLYWMSSIGGQMAGGCY